MLINYPVFSETVNNGIQKGGDEADGHKLSQDIADVYLSPGGKERYWEQVPLVYRKEHYKVEVRECFDEDIIERIEIRDSVTFELKSQANQVILWPATQYLQDTNDLETILQQIDLEKELRIKEFEKA